MALFFGRKNTPPAESVAEEPALDTPEKNAPKGLLDRLRAGLAKTAQVLNTDVRDLFKREGRLVDELFLEELRATLVRTDMGPAAAEAIVVDVRERLRARVVDPDVVIDSIRRQLLARLEQASAAVTMAASGPTVILVTGVNGSGKTTSIAKLANLLQKNGNKVVLAAGDTFRAAAVEQLTLWSERLGCTIVRKESNSDPAAVAYDGVQKAVEIGADYLIMDTAGRLQTQKNLMDELEKIRRVMRKIIPDAPHESLLVLDATTGQNGLSQAKSFSQAIGCTGLILAKLDGTARGGVVIAIRQEMGFPVKYIGVGEQIDDLELFDPDSFLDALFAK